MIIEETCEDEAKIIQKEARYRLLEGSGSFDENAVVLYGGDVHVRGGLCPQQARLHGE